MQMAGQEAEVCFGQDEHKVPEITASRYPEGSRLDMAVQSLGRESGLEVEAGESTVQELRMWAGPEASRVSIRRQAGGVTGAGGRGGLTSGVGRPLSVQSCSDKEGDPCLPKVLCI